MDAVYPVREGARADTPLQLLSRGVEMLAGVTDDARATLASMKIATVLDLGASMVFGTAHRISVAASMPARSMLAAGDFTDDKGLTLGELAAAPVAKLSVVDDKTAAALAKLGAATVRELAVWPPYTTARLIVADAYGDPQLLDGAFSGVIGADAAAVFDREYPDDLVPVSRRYSTERVSYDVLVFDHVLDPVEDETRPALEEWRAERFVKLLKDLGTFPDVGIVGAVKGDRLDVRNAGGIDVSNLVEASLFAKPGLGAVLTYRQSWFPHGLALGHVLHSLGLAAGEARRIAMVDWSRRSRATTDQTTRQTESFVADLSRTRAMSEVTSAVAKEAQSGFSESASGSKLRQSALDVGTSQTFTYSEGLFGGIKNFFVGGEHAGPKLVTTGLSVASVDQSGWASTKTQTAGERSLDAEFAQKINDSTQQASTSTRDRRATSVVEVAESETDSLATRIVVNYNHMHALTLLYFEVVQVYRVITELADLEACLFIPMKLVSFNDTTVFRYRGVIATAGLSPEVRALAFVDPDQLAVVVPRKSAPWDPRFLGEFRQATGYDAAGPADPIARLNTNGLVLQAVGSFEADYPNKVAAVEVTLKNGQRIQLGFTDKGNALNSWTPRWWTELPQLPVRDIAAISLVRKDKVFTGDIDFSLIFNVIGPNGQFLTTAIDVLAMRLATKVRARANEDVTPVFEFAASLASQRLLDHLEENALHYSAAIWRSLDAAAITTLLGTYKLGDRSLIEVIDPVPVTVTGNYLVFRYPGIGEGETKQLRDKIVGQSGSVPVEDMVPLPSGGLFTEAVLGRANSAEKLDVSRFWNWQDSPIPLQPPDIAALQAGSRHKDVSGPAVGDLAAAVATIQQLPELPDAEGVKAALEALVKADIFRDVSGTAATQAALTKALETTEKAQEAALASAAKAQEVTAGQFVNAVKAAGATSGGGIGVGGLLTVLGPLVSLIPGLQGVGVALTAAGAALGAAESLMGSADGGSGGGTGASPSVAGALINAGKALDGRAAGTGSSAGGSLSNGSAAPGTGSGAGGSAAGGVGGSAGGGGAGAGAGAGSSVGGAAGSRRATTLASAPASNEERAFEAALGSGSSALTAVRDLILAALPSVTAGADGGSPSVPGGTTATRHWTRRDSNVVLTLDVEAKLDQIAKAFHDKQTKDIVVTSGTRSAAEQAAAMYTKLEASDNLSDYVNVTARQQIKTAYTDAKAAGETPDQIRGAMTKVIENQIKQGVYISKHLLAGAVDVSVTGMSAADKKAFKDAVKVVSGATALEEKNPPHLHVQF